MIHGTRKPLRLVLFIAAISLLYSKHSFGDQSKLTSNDGQPGDSFGYAAGLYGDVALVGAPRHDLVPFPEGDHGAAYLFERGGDGWKQTEKLTASDAHSAYSFGAAVALGDDRALIGSPDATVHTVEDRAGAAYIFDRQPSGDWTESAKLTASIVTSHFNGFGAAVALDGDRAAVGAWTGGTAYVYDHVGGAWNEAAALQPKGVSSNSDFGLSLDLRGDRLVVGARGDEYDDLRAGSAFVFERVGDAWQQMAKLIPSDLSPKLSFASFGEDVAMAGDLIVVGAPFDQNNGLLASGSAYVFQGSGSSWQQIAKLTPNGAGPQEQFGRRVAIEGGRIVVSAPIEDLTGALYVFENLGGSWTEVERIVPDGPGGAFGWSLDLNQGRAISGGQQPSDGQGAAFVIGVPEPAAGWLLGVAGACLAAPAYGRRRAARAARRR